MSSSSPQRPPKQARPRVQRTNSGLFLIKQRTPSFSQASSQQLLGAIDQLFQKHSVSNQGITAEKLPALLQDAGYVFSQKVMDTMMKLVDHDHSGTIDADELVLLVNYLSTCHHKFKMFDKNNDGKIDRSEMLEALRYFGFAFSPSMITYLYKLIDRDDSGNIEYEEFVYFFLYMALLQDVFSDTDKDSNGTLDESELMSMLNQLQVMGGAHYKDEVAEVIAMIDHNNDKRLNFAEFVELVLILRIGKVI